MGTPWGTTAYDCQQVRIRVRKRERYDVKSQR